MISEYLNQNLYSHQEFTFEDWGELDNQMDIEVDTELLINKLELFLKAVYNNRDHKEYLSYSEVAELIYDLCEREAYSEIKDLLLRHFKSTFTRFF